MAGLNQKNSQHTQIDFAMGRKALSAPKPGGEVHFLQEDIVLESSHTVLRTVIFNLSFLRIRRLGRIRGASFYSASKLLGEYEHPLCLRSVCTKYKLASGCFESCLPGQTGWRLQFRQRNIFSSLFTSIKFSPGFDGDPLFLPSAR